MSDQPDPSRQLAVVPAQSALPDILHAQIERAAEYAKASRAPSTRRAYEADWKIFTAWCAQHGIEALPASADAVAVFASAEADGGTNPRTIGKRISAIAYYHRQAGYVPPNTAEGSGRLLEVLAGIRATHGKPKLRKRAADASALRHMLETIKGEGLRAHRDRALLAIGMSAALRRSELVAFDVAHVGLVDKGIELMIAKSKTDQAREGVVVAIPEGNRIRPKALLLAWMLAAGHSDGPLFRRLTRRDELTADRMSDRAVARLVQRCAAAAGYDPGHYAGHSLRAGFLTEAAANRASIFKMQDVSRHKSVQVLSEYVRNAELFEDHAGSQFL
ncbi:MAG TPA: site-specific integrase [Sphingobium sp.]|uniref:site-specific integrase n=1 Tax=Sphingobium sp. TaxID=1912891 RepID=UPI002ED3256F